MLLVQNGVSAQLLLPTVSCVLESAALLALSEVPHPKEHLRLGMYGMPGLATSGRRLYGNSMQQV
jgi:hypothetical protein